MKRGILSVVALGCALSAATSAAEPVRAILRLKERVSMQQLAADVQNPNSSRYGRYFTPQEIREFAGPADQDYKMLLSQLQDEGFKVVNESKTHLWVEVEADSEQFNETFRTNVQSDGVNRHQMFKALVPSRLSGVEAVIGLDTTHKRHHHMQRMAKTTQPAGISPATIKTVYGFNPIYASGVTGKGQHIAVATYMGFKIADVQSYYKSSNLSPVPKVDQVKFNGTPAYDEDAAGETQLDAEFTGMMAPGAQIHVFASATNDDAGEAAMFTAILDDGRANIINYSWGGCEANLASDHKDEMETIFNRAIAQGVNILVASGDTGSDGCRDGSLSADWPGASPNVVAVGGTSLTVSGSSGRETAWSGSGGGISVLFGLPSWQSALKAPYKMRSFPDVAFNADPNTGEPVYIHTNGKAGWVTIGGTSMASPQWAGFLALVNEARTKNGKSTLGYVAPLIYQASSTTRTSLFNDITSGSNGAYKAAKGWDAVTGLGSMKANALLTYLAGLQ